MVISNTNTSQSFLVAKIFFHVLFYFQEKAIPLSLEGRDILARAKTGSGKTARLVLEFILKTPSTDK